MRRTDGDHAREALEHLQVLSDYVARGSWEDQVMVDAVCLRLAAAIDAVGRVRENTRDDVFGRSWDAIRATRNRIVHGYLTVDKDIVRATVEHDLDTFRASVRQIASPGDAP